MLVIGAISTVQAGDDQAGQKIALLKASTGEWQGTRADGKAVTVTYDLISNGSTVVERIMPEGEPNMMTMYHLDGDRLIMTHYCAAQNQPRMRAESGKNDPKSIKFTFFDATNMANETDGHMHSLELSFRDDDKLNHVWTWRENGQENPVGFELKRVRMARK
ncbi:hypothetical protein MJD09_02735 [bacterium]|nr:hypothetical protein [bacterium]